MPSVLSIVRRQTTRVEEQTEFHLVSKEAILLCLESVICLLLLIGHTVLKFFFFSQIGDMLKLSV